MRAQANTGPKKNGNPAYYRRFLTEELEKRCQRNAKYSLRAFARALQMNPGALSNVLSSKRSLGIKSAQKIIEELSLSPTEARRFIESVLNEKNFSSDLEWSSLSTASEQKQVLDSEAFSFIADWYHLAILQLIETSGFRPDPRWIARELKITEVQAKLALDRLERLNWISRKNPIWVRTQGAIDTGDRGKTAGALRKFQKEILHKSIESLENDPIEIRAHVGSTLAINPEKIPQAKKLIESFLDQMDSLLESGSKTSVYQISVQMFPLQRRKKV